MSYEDLVDNLAGKFLAAARGHQLGVVLSAFGCAARQIADSIGADLEEALETILEEERAVEYEEDRVCNERTRLHADDPPLWAEPVLGLPTKPRDDSSLRPERAWTC